MGISGAEGLYGDALARRNDRLLHGRPSPLKALQTFGGNAVGVGSAITGGGTMRKVTAASFADAEETRYAVLTHAGRAVSDVEEAIRPLRKAVLAIDDSKERKEGRAALTRFDVDLARLVAEAKRMPRRDSDAVLDFCQATARGGARQSGSQ